MNISTIRDSFLFSIIAALVLSVSTPANATNFSILLPGGDGGDTDVKPLRVVNPNYEEGSGEGTNPLYEPSAIIFNPPQLTLGRDVILTLNFGDSISNDYPPAPGGAFVFEVKLNDAATGNPITQFAKPFNIFFEVPRLEPLFQQDSTLIDTLSLGFLDETKSPPEWVVEDSRLSVAPFNDGEVECECSHLTIFSFGPTPVPEPSTALLGLIAIGSMSMRRR